MVKYTEPKIVFLWCHPRSVSTAFERTFMQRQDYATLHEPFGDPFYFGPERISNYFSDEHCAEHEHAKTTYDMVVNDILNTATNKKKLFVKDMAYYVIRKDYKSHHTDNPTVLPIDFLKRCHHTFLIRTPEKALPSFYRCCTSGECGDYDRFNVDDIGFRELQVLFEFLTKLNGSRPVLVDAADLLSAPEAIMKKYCESAIGDRFEPNMLKWKPEKIAAFDKWEGFHDDAQQSTGFTKPIKAKTNSDNDDDHHINLPDFIQEAIKQTMPIYDTLRKFKMLV